MCMRAFVKFSVGQRFHSGGNLQHTVETHPWPESPVNVPTCVNRIGMVDTTGDAEKEIEDIIETHQTNQSGQGFKITPELRKKIEEYSVSKAIQYFQKHKYSAKNVGGTKSYDLDCSKDGDILRVEVKGTQTTGDSIILTPNEVRNAKKHKTALYVLHSIKVDMVRKNYRLSGGDEKIINPWKINEQGKLKALSYMYFINIIDK